MNIEEEIKALEFMIEENQKRIKHLRAVCDHPEEKRTFKYGSDTGNWSKSDDCYWVDIACACGKNWRLDSVMWNWAYRQPKVAILPE